MHGLHQQLVGMALLICLEQLDVLDSENAKEFWQRVLLPHKEAC